jgi:P27 family predicted phage terminase small subunit
VFPVLKLDRLGNRAPVHFAFNQGKRVFDMTKAKRSTAPQPAPDPGDSPSPLLSDQAKALWHSLTDEYDFSDTLGRVMLAEALMAWDRARAASEMIARDGAVVTGADGTPRRHPACGIERDSRAQAIRIFRELGLNLEPVNAVGRPSGR